MGQDRRVVRTKSALTKALFGLLKEKEFDKITVTELTRRADVDRKTFYLHYQSVGDILEEFYDEHISRLQAALVRERGATGVNVTAFFRTLNRQLLEDIDLFRHLASGPAYEFFRERLGEALKRRILQALQDGRLGKPQELEVYAEFWTAGILAVYMEWLSGKVTVDAETLAQFASGIIKGGLESLEVRR